MSDKTFIFPKNFLWGTATSAHQIEGNNNNSNWWVWEQTKDSNKEYPLEPSGIACDSYNRYEEDFDLCLKLNNNAIRFSIEWARIEPDEGVFSEKEINHYKEVLESAKRRGLKTFVTLHHFTNPLWFSKKGGWLSIKSPVYFGRYVRKCAQEFGDLIDVFLTINEPQVYAMQSYTNGMWPPNKTNLFLSLLVQINMMRAHNAAWKAIKSVSTKYKVGIVKNIIWFYTTSHILDRLVVKVLNFVGRDFFLRPIKRKLDLIGLNYYFATRIKNFRTNNPDDRNSDLGWWIEPKGLEKVLLYLKCYDLPIFVTENGVADSEDKLRPEFIRDMLISCARAMQGGAMVKGYFHWSLLDNYEWHHGFWPRFGLVEIDRENNLKRKPRKSFYYYATICKTGIIPVRDHPWKWAELRLKPKVFKKSLGRF